MNGWKSTSLGDVVEFRNGLNFSERNDGVGLPIVKVKDFGDRHFVSHENLDQINPVGLKITDKQLLQRDDIVIVRSNGNKDLVGRSMIYNGPNSSVAFAGFCIRGRVDKQKASPQFIHYWLRSPSTRERFSREGSGTGIQNVSQGLLQSQILALPPLSEQREIAAILSALNDKIELNRKTAATLEEMARALYHSWFVDFDPVWAKTEGRAPIHMDEATAALFPNSFGDDGLPVGWHICALQDHITFKSGKTWPTSLRSENGSAIAYGANGPVGRSSSGLGHGRVIFIGKIGSCGALNYFNGNFWATNNAYYVTSSETESLEYARQVLNEIDWAQYVGGSSNPYMPLKNFDHLTCTVPSCELLSAFEAKASSLRAKIEGFSEEAITLSNLRDALLPKLMSGELRVGAAQQLVEAVA